MYVHPLNTHILRPILLDTLYLNSSFPFRSISRGFLSVLTLKRKKTPWPKSASQLYRRSGRLLLAKLVAIFADRGCQVVSVTDPYGRILGFLALTETYIEREREREKGGESFSVSNRHYI
jgi:hypothetical protein